MKDHEHPFFRPLWRRIAVVAVCIGWALFELYNGATVWAMVVAAFAAYAIWQFFYLYKEPAPEPAPEGASSQDPVPENKE